MGFFEIFVGYNKNTLKQFTIIQFDKTTIHKAINITKTAQQ